jgi:hypothetical protein
LCEWVNIYNFRNFQSFQIEAQSFLSFRQSIAQ